MMDTDKKPQRDSSISLRSGSRLDCKLQRVQPWSISVGSLDITPILDFKSESGVWSVPLASVGGVRIGADVFAGIGIWESFLDAGPGNT